MSPSLRLSVLCLLGVLFANLEVAAGFLPITTTAKTFKISSLACPSDSHYHAQSNLVQSQRRCRAPRGLVLASAELPDDFIDTTAVEQEGSSQVGVDFERQELRAIFEAMDKNNIFYKMLAEEQIVQILELTQALLSSKQMPADIAKLRKDGRMKGKWKLEFSTEERYKYLPTATDIYNYIYDGDEGGRLDNVIRFYKSMIVKNMRAVTKYRMDDEGRFVFKFDSVKAEMFGFKVPLPKFFSDEGFVAVQYFDGDLWVEAFNTPTMADPSEMMTAVNIYRRVGDATEEDKVSIPERTGEQRSPQR